MLDWNLNLIGAKFKPQVNEYKPRKKADTRRGSDDRKGDSDYLNSGRTASRCGDVPRNESSYGDPPSI